MAEVPLSVSQHVEQIGRRSAAYATMIRTDSQLITKGQIAGQGRYEGRGVNARTLNYYDAIFLRSR